MILTETPRRQLVTKLVSWGHWFALGNIVIAIAISGIYLFSSRLPDTPIGIIYLVANWFSHIGFLTFIGFVILILPLCYLVPNSRFLRGYSSITAAIAQAMLALDALLYTKYGIHLTFNSAEFIREHANIAAAELGWRQWGFFAITFVVWLLFQLTMANAIWKRIERFQKFKVGMPISSTFVGLFIFSHATHIWADAELYQPIIQQDDMFPLSYPATAKTLMSKYGMLNIESYKQRKELQLDLKMNSVKYPKEPVYCAVDESKLVLLFGIDENLPDIQSDRFHRLNNHFDLSLQSRTSVKSILYGLPSMYHAPLIAHTPLLLDIPQKLGLAVNLYSYDESLLFGIQGNDFQTWEVFKENLSNTTSGLFIGFVNEAQITEILARTDAIDEYWFISQIANNKAVAAYTNLPIESGDNATHHEDIAGTALSTLGCNIATELHSTGQNLLNLKRNWLVTSQGDKVVVLHEGLRIEVDTSGNYQIFNPEGQAQNSATLNTGLLSQAIKLLSQFAK